MGPFACNPALSLGRGRAFLRLGAPRIPASRSCGQAQTEGLQVLLRSGPCVWGAYDLGGLPRGLLRDREMRLHSQCPGFLSAVRRHYQAWAVSLR